MELSIINLHNKDNVLLATEDGLEQVLVYIDMKKKTISLRENVFFNLV